MTTPVEVEVNDDTKNILDGLAHGDPDLLATGLELRADWRAKSGLDGRAYALVKLAALIALDAPPTCGAIATSTPTRSSGVAPSAIALATCQT